jgi:hypothetical protein
MADAENAQDAFERAARILALSGFTNNEHYPIVKEFTKDEEFPSHLAQSIFMRA